mmetsp:Transcript_15832/g.45283  ORF Transcript_15832/g.45283 Transcript_15832/m.45283 type:complete len:110 (+) Transcript_15832:231-560(+)
MGGKPDAWNIVFKELIDAGLGSLSAKDASELVGGSNAVMVDARTGDMHLLLSAGLSGASRWQWNWRQHLHAEWRELWQLELLQDVRHTCLDCKGLQREQKLLAGNSWSM